MAINIENLDDDESPVFVPRKKRCAVENASNNRENEVLPAKGDAEPVDEGPNSVSKIPEIPAWRLSKERQIATIPEADITAKEKPSKKWYEKSRSEMNSRDWRILRADLEIHSVLSKHQHTHYFPIEPLLSWKELNNDQLVEYSQHHFPQPTPVQRCAIKCVLDGKNLVMQAPTGSGKTLGFLVPLFEKKVRKALILAPTRELAIQIGEVAAEIREYSENLRSANSMAVLVGGHDLADQEKQSQSNPSLVIATPGRLIDFLTTKQVNIADCDYLVFDEADRMIDLGFEPQISEVMKNITSRQRQMSMFSATWPQEVQKLSNQFSKPEFCKISIGKPSETISQSVLLVEDQNSKFPKLIDASSKHRSAIIFVRTKALAEALNQRLVEDARGSKRRSMPLHGSMSQEARTSAVEALRNGKITCLVATDVASRGVDIPGVSLVVNYDMPNNIEVYTHRIGRTGRAGEKGEALSFVTRDDSALFPDSRRMLRKANGTVPAFLVS